MNGPRIGSLFSGYGGLEMGVQQVIGGSTAWHVEFDQAPSKILAHHWPDVPNYGDVTAVDWWQVEPVDVLTGGFPCQDVSLAGLRRGLKDGTRSGLWSEFARAIDVLRPGLVVIENVRGLLSAAADRQMEFSPWGVGDRHDGPALRALGAVLGDLAELGYDASWCGVRAADAGAPHGRYRVFVIARPVNAADDDRDGRADARAAGGRPRFSAAADAEDVRSHWAGDSRHGRPRLANGDLATEDADLAARGERGLAASGEAEGGRSRADSRGRGGALAADSNNGQPQRQLRERPRGVAATGGGDESTADADRRDERRGATGDVAGSTGTGPREGDQRQRDGDAAPDSAAAPREWGQYGAAVARWELATGRVAPAPTKGDGKAGQQRLSAEFVEWMMGLPAGHVTAAGLTRNEQLKALGNGVVPQQAALAVRALLERERVAA